MSDSVKILNNSGLTRHDKLSTGRLHRGHNVTAASSSIPSKYQTVVIEHSEKKGFLSKSKRFVIEDYTNDYPGPGNYQEIKPFTSDNPSHSKKGLGGFASKVSRIEKNNVGCSPGSGTYNIPSMLISRRDFNKAKTTSIFHKPIADTSQRREDFPAPNQYEVNKSNYLISKQNNVTADAAFKSKSKREMGSSIQDVNSGPAPWQYNINERLTSSEIKVPYSSFKSKTKRQSNFNKSEVPGPGAYSPYRIATPVKKNSFNRKHYLCISAPAMVLPDAPEPPGPGSYDIIDYREPEKHFMSSAAFISSTTRWTGNNSTNINQPGPAHYKPNEIGKQSFIFNSRGRWI